MSEKKWDEHVALATQVFDALSKRPKDEYDRTPELEVFFGTNEQIMYESLDSYLDCFNVVEITSKEELVLKKFFTQYEGGPVKYGILPMLDGEDMLNNDDEDGDDDADQ